MANEKPIDAGNDPGFPPSEPTEAPAVSTVGSTNTTAMGDGTINGAISAPTKIEPVC